MLSAELSDLVAQLAGRSTPRRLHNKVDVWSEGGWWEGVVTHVMQTQVHVKLTASGHTLIASIQDVRTNMTWRHHHQLAEGHLETIALSADCSPDC